MQHSDLIEKYKKAQKHFEKGNFIRAKWIFERIVMKLSTSNTDSMSDIHLHNYCEEYLEKIEVKTQNNKLVLFSVPAFFILIGIILLIVIVIFLIIKYAI